jgi:peptidoglycan/xylan/chitin deacetylase (PgdA/CDA1 family)
MYTASPTILSDVQVQDLYADGHEIASHTITHSFGTNFNEEKWANEVVGEAELLVRFGGVNPADIKGMRAPFLAVGGDKMFNMLSRYTDKKEKENFPNI